MVSFFCLFLRNPGLSEFQIRERLARSEYLLEKHQYSVIFHCWSVISISISLIWVVQVECFQKRIRSRMSVLKKSYRGLKFCEWIYRGAEHSGSLCYRNHYKMYDLEICDKRLKVLKTAFAISFQNDF